VDPGEPAHEDPIQNVAPIPAQPPARRNRTLILLAAVLLLAAVSAVVLLANPLPGATPSQSNKPIAAVSQPDVRPAADSEETDFSNLSEYVVEPGDTLLDIAADLGTPVELLEALNDLEDRDQLRVGQVLAYPLAESAAQPPDAGAAVNEDSATGIYVVAEGDTIYSIAEEFGVDPEELAAANELSDPDVIVVGDVLAIPAAM